MKAITVIDCRWFARLFQREAGKLFFILLLNCGYLLADGKTSFFNFKFLIMKNERFDIAVKKTLEDIEQLLTVKGLEYRRNNNVYHNFDVGAGITGETPEKVLHGFLLKHLISAQDIRNDIGLGVLPTAEKVEEKWNDILVYFLIEKAMILERIHSES